MQKFTEYSAVLTIGAIGYGAIELMWRGFTHWTMLITGAVCFLAIYLIELQYPDSPRRKRCLAESLAITSIELAVGFTVNILLGWEVWDYSDLPLNISGQICPLYTVLWFLLCIPAGMLCKKLSVLFKKIIPQNTITDPNEKSAERT